MTSPAPEPPHDPRSPILLEDALALGVSAVELRSSRWQQIFRGVYVSSAVPFDQKIRARAALMLHTSGAHVSHTTAARLLRIPVPDDPYVHVTVQDQRDRRSRPGLRPHTREAGSITIDHGGVRITAPLQLFVELAGQWGLVDAVVAGDAMVRQQLVTLTQLQAHCRLARGKSSRRARRAVAYVRRDVDSPMETRLRMLIVLAGLPEPAVDHRITAADGTLLRRIDLSYPLLRIAIEYDGRQHIERVEQWEHDIDRREEFDESDWRTLVVTASGVLVDPEKTLQRIRRALKSRGVTVRRLDQRWREHFPGR